MSQRNVEVVRAAYRAIHGLDTRALARLFTRDIALKSDVLDDRIFRGRNGVRAYAEQLRRARHRPPGPDVDDVAESGDHVVAVPRARVQETGVALDLPVAHVWRIRRGKVAGLRTYRSLQEALDAVRRE